jgi:hypothetical protein
MESEGITIPKWAQAVPDVPVKTNAITKPMITFFAIAVLLCRWAKKSHEGVCELFGPLGLRGLVA